jgi:hypothetical protein
LPRNIEFPPMKIRRKTVAETAQVVADCSGWLVPSLNRLGAFLLPTKVGARNGLQLLELNVNPSLNSVGLSKIERS